MQLKIEHQHQEPEVKPIPKKDSPKALTKKEASTKKMPPSPIPAELQPKSAFFDTANYNRTYESGSNCFFTEDLEDIRRGFIAEYGLNEALVEVIKERGKFSEDRVYNGTVNSNLDFVAVHFKDVNHGIKNSLHQLFEDIHSEVEAGIWDGRYDVGRRKNYHQYNQKEQQLLTYITEELVRKNINSFKNQLDQSEVGSDVLEVSVSHRAKAEIQKTKKAEEFVKKMQEEQMKNHEVIERKRDEERELEVRSMQERDNKAEQMKRERQQFLRQRIERKKEKARQQNEHNKKIHGDYIKFLSKTKKSMHVEMQQKFERQMMQEQREKFKKMKKLMNERQPMTFDHINQHMQKYDELLYENQQYRKEKVLLKEHQMQIIASNKPYRSKFYSIAAKGSPKIDQKQIRTSLVKKQISFAENVKKNYMPKTDERKQQELEELVKRIHHQNKSAVNSRKYIDQGNRNLQKLHLLIGELRAKNKLKENVGLETILESRPQRRYKNYLQEVKQSKLTKDITSMSVDYDLKLDKEDSEFVKLQAFQRQSKAKQKDIYLDSAIEILDFDSHMKGKKSVEHDFMESAKAKMAILKKFNGEAHGTIQ